MIKIINGQISPNILLKKYISRRKPPKIIENLAVQECHTNVNKSIQILLLKTSLYICVIIY